MRSERLARSRRSAQDPGPLPRFSRAWRGMAFVHSRIHLHLTSEQLVGQLLIFDVRASCPRRRLATLVLGRPRGQGHSTCHMCVHMCVYSHRS